MRPTVRGTARLDAALAGLKCNGYVHVHFICSWNNVGAAGSAPWGAGPAKSKHEDDPDLREKHSHSSDCP